MHACLLPALPWGVTCALLRVKSPCLRACVCRCMAMTSMQSRRSRSAAAEAAQQALRGGTCMQAHQRRRWCACLRPRACLCARWRRCGRWRGRTSRRRSTGTCGTPASARRPRPSGCRTRRCARGMRRAMRPPAVAEATLMARTWRRLPQPGCWRCAPRAIHRTQSPENGPLYGRALKQSTVHCHAPRSAQGCSAHAMSGSPPSPRSCVPCAAHCACLTLPGAAGPAP